MAAFSVTESMTSITKNSFHKKQSGKFSKPVEFIPENDFQNQNVFFKTANRIYTQFSKQHFLVQKIDIFLTYFQKWLFLFKIG